jgi:hypothetical protein
MVSSLFMASKCDKVELLRQNNLGSNAGASSWNGLKNMRRNNSVCTFRHEQQCQDRIIKPLRINQPRTRKMFGQY